MLALRTGLCYNVHERMGLMLLSDIRTGEDFESYIYDILKNSRICVDRTKKSHDYGADLLVYLYGLKYVVQCKWSVNPVGVGAVQEVMSSLIMYGADKGVVVTNSRFTSEARRLAVMNGCLLFDGNECQPYISEDSEMGLDWSLFHKRL